MERGQGDIVPRPICAVSPFLIRAGEGNGRDESGNKTKAKVLQGTIFVCICNLKGGAGQREGRGGKFGEIMTMQWKGMYNCSKY